MTEYTIWIQTTSGKTILDPGTSRFNAPINDSVRRGIMQSFPILTINDPKSYMRLQISSSPNGNIDIARIYTKKPILPIGVISVDDPITPLVYMAPESQRKYPTLYFVLLKSPKTTPEYPASHYLLSISDIDELSGILTVINWLNLNLDDTIIAIEDINGNDMKPLLEITCAINYT